jgi:hypothetical protein
VLFRSVPHRAIITLFTLAREVHPHRPLHPSGYETWLRIHI